MKDKLILALDQGTTSSRAIVFNHKGEIVKISQKPFEQIFPKPGWEEHESALPVTGPSHSISCVDLSCAAHTGEVGFEGSGPAFVRIPGAAAQATRLLVRPWRFTLAPTSPLVYARRPSLRPPVAPIRV